MILYFKTCRHVVLLEVLIAFALVVLCALPLIYPHVYILKSEKAFVDTVQLDHAVNLFYGNLLEKLYQKKISWGDIESGKQLPIDSSMLQEVGYDDKFPFIGTYRFEEIRHKTSEEKSAYLNKLIFNFIPKNKYVDTKSMDYVYTIVIERKHK